MKKMLMAIAMVASITPIFAQESDPVSPEIARELKEIELRRAEQKGKGVREGETEDYCTTHWKMQEMLAKHPAMKRLFDRHEDALELETIAFEKNKDSNPLAKAGTVYTIPVVFHILHQNGSENISVDQVENALFIMNRDYRLLNADAGSVAATFTGLPADAEIEFALATKAPDGSCFNGITRTYSPLSYDGSSGIAQVQEIVDENNVYQGLWEGDEYLNIFVCGDIGGAAGYTYRPGSIGSAMNNGIWVKHTYVGSIGTANVSRSRTLTHEAGHWLNLKHCWGGTNDPGVSCGNDNVSDTPTTEGWSSCTLSGNTCGGGIDNVENYMEYSYCSKMFTQGQVNRMRNALTSSTDGRNNLWTTSNLNAVGANGAPLTLCKADFNADSYEICEGDDINFSDFSYNNVTGWTWSFPGGTPSSSNLEDPTITYLTAGTYSVTLQATDGSSTVSETKTAYITVLPNVGVSAPIQEGFEGISSLPTAQWFIENPDGGFGWNTTSVASYTGSTSMRMINTSANDGNKDDFISNTIDLSSASAVTLSFKYSFAKRATADADKLQIWASGDCGNTWSLRKNISSATIATSSNIGGNYVPSSTSQWEEVVITNISSSFWTSNFRFKITFTAGGGNNMYIDDINIDTSTDIDELSTVSEFGIYPNPFSEVTNVEFNLIQPSDVKIEVYDVVGKLMQSNIHSNRSLGENRIPLNVGNISKGMYLVKLTVGTNELTKRIIIE